MLVLAWLHHANVMVRGRLPLRTHACDGICCAHGGLLLALPSYPYVEAIQPCGEAAIDLQQTGCPPHERNNRTYWEAWPAALQLRLTPVPFSTGGSCGMPSTLSCSHK